MEELFADPDPERARRAMQAMLTMRKLDIAALRARRRRGGRRLSEAPAAGDHAAERPQRPGGLVRTTPRPGGPTVAS